MSVKKYYAVYKSQFGKNFDKKSKLQVRVEWDVDGDTITDTSYTVTGRAGAVGHTFHEISYETDSGGVGEGYYTVYAEGDYSDPLGEYTHWVEVRAQDDGSSFANTSYRTVKVDEGTR
jgi:hypothetical protein